MKNNLLLEIHRVHEIMGVKTNLIIKEQVTVTKLLKNVISSFGDDSFTKFIKTSKNYVKQTSDDLLRKFKAGTITDDELKLFLKNINWDEFAKTYLKNPDLFGSVFVDTVEKYYNGIIKNPSKYNEVIAKLNGIIDDKTYFTEMPISLKNSIKRQIKSKMDDALSKSKSSPKPKPSPIVDDSFTRQLTSVTPSEFDELLKNLSSKLGLKLKLKGKNLELFKEELIDTFGRQFKKKFPDNYSSQLSFISDKLSKLPPTQQKALLTNIQTDLEKSFGDILNKGNFSIAKKEELKKLLRMGFDKPFEGSVVNKLKTIFEWWAYTIKVSFAISATTLISDILQGEWVDRVLSQPGTELKKYLRRVLMPGWNVVESGFDAIVSIYRGLLKTFQTSEEEKGGSMIDKGESELFKRKIMKKYPSFKFINNITIKYGQPYLKNNDIDYPIYEDNNGRYFIEVDNEGIYFENLTN